MGAYKSLWEVVRWFGRQRTNVIVVFRCRQACFFINELVGGIASDEPVRRGKLWKDLLLPLTFAHTCLRLVSRTDAKTVAPDGKLTELLKVI